MVLSGLHPNMEFTIELPVSNEILFIGIEIVKSGTKLETRIYNKPTNTDLHNHVIDIIKTLCKRQCYTTLMLHLPQQKLPI